MDPSTELCAAILIYIRGLHPSLNQGTTSICYLNDKQQLQKVVSREGWGRKKWTNQFGFQSGEDTRFRVISLMKKGSSSGLNTHNCLVSSAMRQSPQNSTLFQTESFQASLPYTYLSFVSSNI